jgi:hypothetical protein
MNEANDFERSETMPPSGSAGDGGVVEEAGTLGGMTADADGEIVQEERNAPGTPASESEAGDVDYDSLDADSLDAAGSDADIDAPEEWGTIPGFEDLESDPGV